MGYYNQKTLTRLSRRARRFIKSTDKFLIHDLRPGGIYDGIWRRDASYILQDWFLSSKIEQTLREIHNIWSYQIEEKDDGRKLIYGRGSPEMDFMPVISNDKTWRRFQGSLPTSIFQDNNVMEVFGKNPDIDSTALMISTTCWILTKLLQKRSNNKGVFSAKQILLIIGRSVTRINNRCYRLFGPKNG